MDTQLYDLSIPYISSLQNQLSEQANVMQLISSIFDPKYAFLIYSPIAYLCNQKVGKRLIMTTVVAEWLSQILKWLLHGERPYWYVHSSGHFDPQQVPIKQFPITCELGPGHPSGHAMVTAAVWYIILNAIVEATTTTSVPENDRSARQIQWAAGTKFGADKHQVSHNRTSVKATVSSWLMLTLLLLTVSVSRVFLGCHFPHQCLAGSILGVLVARWVSRLELKASHFVGWSVFVFGTAFGTFGLMQWLNMDPSWTIKLALKHCEKREYIHLDTAPFFSIMRYAGMALGCGLGLALPLRNYTKQLVNAQPSASDKEMQENRNLAWFSMKLCMLMLMARLVDNLGLFVSQSNLSVFYSGALVAYTLFSMALVNL